MLNFDGIIKHFLEQACDKMRLELHKVDRTFFITHNGSDTIEVYGNPINRAYVPKKYDGWVVSFTEWDGNEITYSLDSPIDYIVSVDYVI